MNINGALMKCFKAKAKNENKKQNLITITSENKWGVDKKNDYLNLYIISL